MDDATFIRDLLKKNLRDNFPNCQVLDCDSAKKAQVVMKSNRVDLILCDWEMPEMTGEEFLRWIRADQQHASLPFIMVTSRGEKDFIIKAVEAGVSEYLGKPFKPETLVAKVTKALQKAGKSVKTSPVSSDNTVQASGSLDILTGGTSQAAKAPAKAALSDSASILTGGSFAQGAQKKNPAQNKTAQKKTAKSATRGQAQLNFPEFKTQCIINDITLQLLRGAIKREDNMPAVFDTVVISIVQNDGQDVARLNGYVHAIEAGENRVDAGVLKITIRFVDDDAEKLEHLSRYIATL